MRSQRKAFPCRLNHRVLLVLTIFALFAPRWAAAQDSDYVPRSMDDLQQLVAPIALYPDALLAQVLTASTYPDDVIAAAAWLDAGNDSNNAGSQPWDSSVQGLTRYSTVLHYMASNGDWMNDLGDAFLNQQDDVMTAVQNLRGEALAAGTLTNTAEQTVINQDGYIQIVPTDPDYLYAPVYDPAVVYSPPPIPPGSAYPIYFTFGARVPVGDWLDFDCDWHDRTIYSGRWGRDRPWWHRGGDFRYVNVRPGVYAPGRFRDDRGREIQVQASRWTRDNKRPPPKQTRRTVSRPVAAQPARGYPARTTPPQRTPQPTGAEVARQAERGRTSRQRASQPAAQPLQRQPVRTTPTPQPQRTQRTPQPQRTPEPQRTAPPQRSAPPIRSTPTRTAEPARSTPRAAPTGSDLRSSAPTRGGAMGGYQNSSAAASASSRGASSRGRR